MKTLKDLRARLEQLNAEAQAIIDKDEMTAEDQTTFDAKMEEIRTTKAAIDNIKQLEANDQFIDDLDVSRGRRTKPEQPGANTVTGGEDRRSKDPWLGFKGAGDFFTTVRAASSKSGSVDPRLAEVPTLMGAPTNFHYERGSDEGYMVPPALRDGVWEAVESYEEEIFNDVDAEPTASNSVQMVRDESTPWGGSGVQAYWAGEADQLNASKLVTKASLVQLHKLFAFVLTTDELLEDAPRLFDRLTRKSAQAITFTGSKAIVEGTGAGQPLGYLDAGGPKVEVAKESNQSGGTLNANNIAKMYARCINPAMANWYINQDVLPQLFTMTLGDQPIWTPPREGFKQAPGGFLLGRPVKISEHCATLGTAGDIHFVNPKGYYSPRKPGVKFASSLHLYFDYDVEAFRWTFRMGGQPYLESAISPNKGSSSRSHFVTLATRS